MRRFHPLITGTLILTSVGFFCRILGFFYRIFLSRTIGAEGLGLYQMIFPIHGIAFALCAGPIQTSLSRLTAASPEKGRAFLRVSLALSLSIALPLTSLIYTFADFLAARVLLAPECAPLLPALALSIPFCSDPCLLLRVLLWAQKNGSPGIFTGGRAVHPHFLRPADRPCLPHEQDSDHGAAGCLGAVDRGSGFGYILPAGIWKFKAGFQEACHGQIQSESFPSDGTVLSIF